MLSCIWNCNPRPMIVKNKSLTEQFIYQQFTASNNALHLLVTNELSEQIILKTIKPVCYLYIFYL